MRAALLVLVALSTAASVAHATPDPVERARWMDEVGARFVELSSTLSAHHAAGGCTADSDCALVPLVERPCSRAVVVMGPSGRTSREVRRAIDATEEAARGFKTKDPAAICSEPEPLRATPKCIAREGRKTCALLEQRTFPWEWRALGPTYDRPLGGELPPNAPTPPGPLPPGAFGKTTVLLVVKRAMPLFQACASHAPANTPSIIAKTTFTVDGTGQTTNIAVASPWSGTAVGKCIVGEVRKLRFPAPPTPTPITFPLKIR